MCSSVLFDEEGRWWGSTEDSVEECKASIDKSFLFDKWYCRWFFSFIISFFILPLSILEPITRDLETWWCWNWWMLESVFVVVFHCLLRPLESSNRIILSFVSGWKRLNVKEECFSWFCWATFSRLSRKKKSSFSPHHKYHASTLVSQKTKRNVFVTKYELLKNFLKTIKNYFQHVPCTLELNIEYKYVLNVDLYL